MAIRGPQGPRVPEQVLPGLKKDQAASPLQRLVEFGMARTPQEARRLINELLASLRAAGFPVPKTGSPEQQLKTALEQFQKSEGLPADGQLDKATLEKLLDGGHLQPPDAGVQTAVVARGADLGLKDIEKLKTALGGGEFGLPTGGEVPADAKSPKKTEVDEKARAGAADKPPPLDLKNFVAALRNAGFASFHKGAEQLKDAIKQLQQKDGLPQTGRIDSQTAEALVKRGLITEAQARDLVPTVSDAQMNPPQDATFERAGGGEPGDVRDGEVSPGNAPSGDNRVDDKERGHASIKDDAQHDEGHYEVPSLAIQLSTALEGIVRDDGGRGAATYAWDVTLYRPGVYGRKQAAEMLFHVVVKQASAFDPLWDRARAAINDKIAAFEPETEPLTDEEFVAALRRARVR